MINKLLYCVLILSFSAPLAGIAQYCTPSTECNFGDGVRLMTIGPFSNISDCEADLGVAGYADFTDVSGLSLGQGVTYEAQFRSDFGSQQFSIWIDMDNSSSFESSELVLTDLLVGTEVVTSSITVPASLPLGDYRLRVQATWNGPSSTDACTQGTYGETEDYTLTVTTPPTCINVSGLNVTGLSATSATIGWVDAGTATVWDVEWGPTGFTPTGTPTVGYDDIDNPTVLSDLNPVTVYDVYVRADCGMDNETDVSVWTSAFSFITACGAVQPPYVENFTDGLGACWANFGSGDMISGPMDEGFSNWYDNGFANTPQIYTGSQGIYMFGSNENHWLVSPDFDLSNGGPFQLEFDQAITASFTQNATTLGSDDKLRLLISEDFGANWITMDVWDNESETVPSGEHKTYDLSPYAGNTVRFGYYISNGEVDDFNDYQVFFDNFRIQELGSPLSVEIDLITTPECYSFGNVLADVLINVSGGVAPYTFLWTDGTTTEDLLDSEAGTVTVTVTDGDGNEFVSDPIEVPGTPVLSVIAIITDESYDGFNDGSIEITDVVGGQGPYNYQWNSGATSSTITGLIDAYWCVTITDNNGCQSDTCLEVMQGLPPSGLSEFEYSLGLEIYPNPSATGVSQINADLTSGDAWQLTISDALGRIVSSESIKGARIYNELIDLSSKESGVYTVRLIRSDDGAYISRLLMR